MAAAPRNVPKRGGVTGVARWRAALSETIPTGYPEGVSCRERRVAAAEEGAIVDAVQDTHESTHGYITDKEKYLQRLKRIEGQARGISRMVDEEKYCIDILTQISALTSALQAVGLGLLDDHLSHCVVDAARKDGPEAQEKLKEASDAIARLVKS
ncbi:metal-sensitive transcriptional regulator [Leucobacter aridicollis]|nr:metal-sensitive transcriptional regulator [Leucobacter aridicollis]